MNKLKISLGKTYNIGNYESVRIDVGMEVEKAVVTDTDKGKLFDEVCELMASSARKVGVGTES